MSRNKPLNAALRHLEDMFWRGVGQWHAFERPAADSLTRSTQDGCGGELVSGFERSVSLTRSAQDVVMQSFMCSDVG